MNFILLEYWLEYYHNYVNIKKRYPAVKVMICLRKGARFMQKNDNMDRRKYKRLPIELSLEVDEVFKQDHVIIKNLGASISVFDISKNGIGFISEANLPVEYYFYGMINLGGGDFFRVVIQIVRKSDIDNNQKVYGAEFVGLAPFLADKVDRYEKKLCSKN